jgi:threonine/homoserine/homoserine lactone efflux protein
MALNSWIAFLVAALITALTPGQAILLAVSNSLERGRHRAMMSSRGKLVGVLVICWASAAGLGMLIKSTPGALKVIKFVGVFTLQGLTVATTNPKSILFVSAMFPQSAGTGAGLPMRFFIMTCTYAASSVVTHASFIVTARWASMKLQRHGSAKLARRLGGTLFIGLGISVLLVRV